MALIGLGAPLPYVEYVNQRKSIRQTLVDGLVEVDGDDPLERLINGLEGTGTLVRSGSLAAATSSKFAATMLLALRAALGRLEKSEVNFKLAEAEYRRICRARNIRLLVVEQHRAITIDAFFNEDVFDEVVASKQRLPIWLRWLMWYYKPAEPSLAKYW